MKKIIVSTLVALITSTAAQAQTGGYVIYTPEVRVANIDPDQLIEPIADVTPVQDLEETRTYIITTESGYKIKNTHSSSENATKWFEALKKDGQSIRVAKCQSATKVPAKDEKALEKKYKLRKNANQTYLIFSYSTCAERVSTPIVPTKDVNVAGSKKLNLGKTLRIGLGLKDPVYYEK